MKNRKFSIAEKLYIYIFVKKCLQWCILINTAVPAKFIHFILSNSANFIDIIFHNINVLFNYICTTATVIRDQLSFQHLVYIMMASMQYN